MIQSVASISHRKVELAPHVDTDELRERGRQHSKALEWTAAFTCWRKLAKSFPGDYESWYRQAESLFFLGEIAVAAQAARHAWGLAPKDARAGFILARSLHRLQDWAEAAPCWLRLLTLESKNFEAAYRLAQALVGMGQDTVALKACQYALVLKPGDGQTLKLLQRLAGEATPIEGIGITENQTIQLSEAREMSRQKRWAEAEEAWQAYTISAGKDFEGYYRLAQAHFEQGHTAQALAASRQAAELRPDDSRNQILLARLLTKVMDWNGAELCWRQVLGQYPADFEACYRLGQVLFEQGKTADASKYLEDALAQHPDHVEVSTLLTRLRLRAVVARNPSDLSWRTVVQEPVGAGAKQKRTNASPLALLIEDGRTASNNRDWHEALQLWASVVRQQPDHFEGWYRQAQACFHLAQFSDVISHAEKARQHRRTHAGNLTLLGRAQQRIGAMEASMECWHAVLQLVPDSYEAVYRLGQCLAAADRLDEAEQRFAAAQLLKPDSIDVVVQRATVLVKRQRKDRAMECWQRFLEANPNNLFAQKRFASFLRTHKRTEEAEQVLRAVMAQHPDDLEAAFLLGNLQIETQRWAEVVTLLEPLAARMKDDSASLQGSIIRSLALALDAMGRLTDAERQYRASLVHEPENISSLTRLGRVLRQLGKPDEAVVIRRRACEVAPQDPGNWAELIFLLASLERELEAREALKLAQETLPQSAAMLARMGRICESALFLPEARDYFRKALAMDESMAKEAGLFYARQGVLDEALKYLSLARDQEPESIETATALIEQIKVCELFGMTQSELIGQAPACELLLPELLFESMAAGLLARCQTYEPVPGRVVLLTGSLAAGGAERQLVTTIRGLVKRTSQVESVTLLTSSLSKRFKKDFYLPEIADLPVQIRAMDVPEQRPVHRPVLSANARLMEAFPFDMRESIEVWYQEFVLHRPAVVHAWQDSICLTAVVAAALAGVPRILLSTRSSRPDNPRRRLKRYMQRAYRAVLQLPNVIMLNNSQAGASDYENWLGLSAGTVSVIYNGLDFDRLLHAADEKEMKRHRQGLNIPAGAPVLGGVFRMSEEKRPLLWVETAAEVLREVPDAHFVVAGDGPMRDDMLARAQQLGMADRLHLPGHVSVPSWFLMMDVLLLTSRMEGLPNVLLEAQSFGIPVVAPDVGGVAEAILQGKTGWALPNATAASMASKIVFMLKNPKWHRKARTAAAAFAKRGFSVDAMVDKTLAIYGFDAAFNKQAPLTATAQQPVDSLRAVAMAQTADGSDVVRLAWTSLLEQLPDDAEAHMWLAQRQFEQREYGGATVHLKAVVAVEPCHAEAWRWLGRAQQVSGEYPNAITSWRRVLALKPDDFEAHYRLGELLVRVGEDGIAMHLLRAALALKPEHEATLRILARLLQGQGERQSALHLWLQLHEINGDDFEAAYRAGQLSLEAGEGEQALRLLQHANRLDPANDKPVDLLVRQLMWRGELHEARKLAFAHLRHNERSIEAIALLGRVLVLQGRAALMQRVLLRLQRQADLSGVAVSLRYARWLLAWGEYERVTALLPKIKPPAGSERAEHRELQIAAALKTGNFEKAAALCATDAPAQHGSLAADYAAFKLLCEAPKRPKHIQDVFLKALTLQYQSPPSPVYEPIARSVLHVVNSLAMGGTEKQAALTAALQTNNQADFGPVTLLRVDPAHAGRAGFFLPYVQDKGVRTGTLDEFSKSDLSNMEVPLLLRVSNGHIRNALGLSEIERLYRAFVNTRPAVVHAWTPQTAVHCAIAGLLAGVPRLVLRVGSVAPGDRPFATPDEKYQYAWFQSVLKQALKDKRVRLVANCAKNLQGWLDWVGISAQRTGAAPMITHNIIDLEQLGTPTSKQVKALRTRLKIRPAEIVVGTVARLEPEKGIDLWLDCVAQLTAAMPNVVFMLIGNGRLHSNVNRELANRGLTARVRIVTDAGAELGAYYSLMDVFLQTSYIEGLPNAVLEGQAFNVPVVATDVGGTAEALTGYRQAKLVNRNADEIVLAVKALITKRSTAASKRLRQALKRFSPRPVLGQLKDSYHMEPNNE